MSVVSDLQAAGISGALNAAEALTKRGYRILAPGQLCPETLEAAAQYHDGQAEGYRAHKPRPGEDDYETQVRFHEISAAQIRTLQGDDRD